MKRFFSFTFFLVSCSLSFAAGEQDDSMMSSAGKERVSHVASAPEKVLDKETINLCNKVMLNIYDDIAASKERFPELRYFNEGALAKNPYGIYEIKYENKDYLSPRGEYDYKFALTIVGMDDSPHHEKNAEGLSFGLPVLGLKFVGYQTMRIRGRRYALEHPINKFSPALYDHQQKYTKLRLILEPEKAVYKIGERISFKATLINKSSQNLKVKALDEKTLFFTINNKVWGTVPDAAKPGTTIKPEEILYPTYSIDRGFKGDSFERPQEVEIRGTYNMAYKGVLPMNTIKIKIVP